MKDRVIISWSGGKDSALSLYEVIRNGTLEPVGLLTTLTKGYDRVTLHGVRRSLVESQASALGMPLHTVYIPKNCSNEDYERIMKKALNEYEKKGIKGFVFGDTFLEDVRKYREEKLSSKGFKGYFPLWKRKSRELVHELIELGFKAITVCVDGDVLDSTYVGRDLDRGFLDNLPPSVDPTGENGEYHCFVWSSPLFKEPVSIRVGDVIERGKFHYCDLLPVEK